MLKQAVSFEYYQYEVRRRAYLIWENRMRADHLDDWRDAKSRTVGLVPPRRREEDIRWWAYKVYQERLAKTVVDDWLEAERQIGREYEITA